MNHWRRRTCISWVLGAALALATQPAAAAPLHPGALDPSFGVRGRATVDIPLTAAQSRFPSLRMATAPHGATVILAGQSLSMINRRGQLAAGFGHHGIVYLSEVAGEAFTAGAMTVDELGRVLIAGTTKGPEEPTIAGGTLSERRATVLRFTAAGQLDSTFANDGVASYTFGFKPPMLYPPNSEEIYTNLPEVWANGIAIAPGNLPVLTGSDTTTRGPCRDLSGYECGSGTPFIARLEENGLLDPSFGSSGLVSLQERTSARSPLVNGQGTVYYINDVVPTEGEADFVGSVDANTGVDNPNFGEQQIQDHLVFTVDRNGTVFVLQLPGGDSPKTTNRVLAIGPDGTPVPSFGTDGAVHLPRRFNRPFTMIGVDNRQRVLLAGQFGRRTKSFSSANSMDLIRLLPDGTRDKSFGKNGWVQTYLGATVASEGMAVLPSGRITLGALTQHNPDMVLRLKLVRYLP